jgi:hypothetical protein
MTDELYEKLKAYVASGGRLLMSAPHLNVETDRLAPLAPYGGGDVSDLFGVRVQGSTGADVLGVRFLEHPTGAPWSLFHWMPADPMFLGRFARAEVELVGGRVLAAAQAAHRGDPEELRGQPLLVEHQVGKGAAYLLCTWDPPGARDLRPFVENLLQQIVSGEPGPVRVSGSDRVRHAIWEHEGVHYVYWLNTDPDVAQHIGIHLEGSEPVEVEIPAASLALGLWADQWLLLPDDPCIDLEWWAGANNCTSEVTLFNLSDQVIRVVNNVEEARTLTINGAKVHVSGMGERRVSVARREDPGRREVFAQQFLEEPGVTWRGGGTPY